MRMAREAMPELDISDEALLAADLSLLTDDAELHLLRRSQLGRRTLKALRKPMNLIV